MRRPQLNVLLIGGLIAALLTGIGLSHYMQGPAESENLTGLVLQSPRTIADFALETQHGLPYDKTQLNGRWQLMFFGFTHCPDVCPTTLAQMRQLKLDLPEATREKIDFVFVSVDPQRDTGAVMRPYLAHFDPAFIGVTADDAALEQFAGSLGMAYVKVGDDDDYSMDHSTALVLLNPQGQIKAYFSAPHVLPELRNTLITLVSA